MKIEEIFKEATEGSLTLEQFNEIVSSKGAKFVDLSEGKYVSESKYSSELSAKDKQIETLNGTLSDRDKDLETLKQQLTDAGNDSTKLSEVSTQLATLQAKYEEDTKSYEAQLATQAREFAIKEHANSKKFTSGAAKRDYIEQMKKSADVKFKKDELIGAEDFDTQYSTDNADAFEVEAPKGPEPTPAPTPEAPKPQFSAPTPGGTPASPKPSLSDLMKAKNDNPELSVSF